MGAECPCKINDEINLRGSDICLEDGTKRNEDSRTVVSMGARIRSRLPILYAVEGMRYYGVDDLYNGNYSVYEHEILCPWEITKDEIVELRRPSSTLVPAKNHPSG